MIIKQVPVATGSQMQVETAPADVSRKTIVLVVKGRLFSDGLRSILEAPDRVIISNHESLSQVADTHPPADLFVLGGGEAEHLTENLIEISRLRERMPAAKWLVLSGRTGKQLVRKASAAGVDWLLPEDAPAEVLRVLTRLILLGQPGIPTSLTPIAVDDPQPVNGESAPNITVTSSGGNGKHHHLASDKVIQPLPAAQKLGQIRLGERNGIAIERDVPNAVSGQRRKIELSDRENEILGCLVSGLSNKAIARKLNIAEATVKVHVKGLLRKMQVSNRTQAAILALSIPDGSGRPRHEANGTML
jgi:two-component system nitrate/nitrite response regulator NarL